MSGVCSWLDAVVKGVISLQLKRELGISQECCWHMVHRIRAAMAEDRTNCDLFKGIVQADEYFHGGRPRPKKHQIQDFGKDDGRRKRGPSGKKQPIVGAIEAESALRFCQPSRPTIFGLCSLSG